MLRDREADVLRVRTDTAIAPTKTRENATPAPPNPAESIRAVRSEKTARDRYAVRGYASTAVKHGHPASPPSTTRSQETREYRLPGPCRTAPTAHHAKLHRCNSHT